MLAPQGDAEKGRAAAGFEKVHVADGPSGSRRPGGTNPSMTISACAGTSSSFVSQGTISSGAPRRAPATPSSSPRMRATEVSGTGGSQPITTAHGVGVPCRSFFMRCAYMSRHVTARGPAGAGPAASAGRCPCCARPSRGPWRSRTAPSRRARDPPRASRCRADRHSNGPEASTEPARQAGMAFSGSESRGRGWRAGGDQQDDSKGRGLAREQ
jgi:hypothetical protein